MEKFNSIRKALRHLKNIALSDLKEYAPIYLAVDYYGETFYLAKDKDQIQQLIESDFYSNSADREISNHAEKWKVYEYKIVVIENGKPLKWWAYSRVKFSTPVHLYRKELEIEPEPLVYFNF